MRFSPIASLVLSLSLFACERATPPKAAPAEPAEPAKAAEPDWQAGTALPEAKGITVAELNANPDKLKDAPVQLEGTVTSVCQHRGCWVELADGDNKVMVKSISHDIAFPKDGVGRKMKVEGVVRVDLAESCGEHAHEAGEEAHECPKPRVLVEVRRATLSPQS